MQKTEGTPLIKLYECAFVCWFGFLLSRLSSPLCPCLPPAHHDPKGLLEHLPQCFIASGQGLLGSHCSYSLLGKKNGLDPDSGRSKCVPNVLLGKESPRSSAGRAAQRSSLGPFPALSCLLAALQNVTLVQRRDLGSNLKSVSSNVGNLGLPEPGA